MNSPFLKGTIELHPLDICTADKIGNSELRDILREYYGNNEISYTADFDRNLWGEVLSYLERECKLIKDIEINGGTVFVYETGVVNEYLVRFEGENGKFNFLFWKNKSINGIVSN